MRCHVLIVDDEEPVIELLRINLERRGFTVAVAQTAEDALRQAKNTPPQLVLLDIRLPDFDGWEVCSKLRGSPDTCNSHIVILTASVQKEDLLKAANSGANEFLPKPFDLNQLLSMIQRLHPIT